MCGNKWELVPPHALQATWSRERRASNPTSIPARTAHLFVGTNKMEPKDMTTDELLHLAYAVQNHDATPIIVFTFEELQQFAQVVAENEREACALLCQTMTVSRADDWKYDGACIDCANAIRARGVE